MITCYRRFHPIIAPFALGLLCLPITVSAQPPADPQAPMRLEDQTAPEDFPEAKDQRLVFTAPDQVRVSACLRQGGVDPKPRLVIVAPGYAQHSSTASMQTLASALTATADVLIMDFRGNGASGGRFTFGAEEYRDLQPALEWAEQYDDVSLLGFSLGAYHAIRASEAFPGRVRRLLLVSCPTSVEEIVTSGGAFWNPLTLLFRSVKFRYPPENDQGFRWGWPFAAKPDSAALAARLAVPCHFLVGGKDALVFEGLSRKVYEAVPGLKTWTRFENGVHAEEMFMQFPEDFMAWLAGHLQP